MTRVPYDRGCMSSPILHRKLAARVSFLLAGIIFLLGFLLLFTDAFLSADRRIELAKEYFTEWKLSEAEEVLSPVIQQNSFPSSEEVTTQTKVLYADILLARGELHRARTTYLSITGNATEVGSSTALQTHLLLSLATAQYFLGNLDSATLLAHHAISIASETRDTLSLSQAYSLLGRIDFNRGDYKRSRTHQRHALDLARFARSTALIGSKKTKADAMRQLGVLYWYQGERDSAMRACYEPALALYREVNDKAGEATTISNIGLIYHDWGDWQQNLAYQIKAFDIRKQIGDQVGLADSYYFLSYLPFLGGRPATHMYATKSLDLSRRIGYAWGEEVAGRMLSSWNYDFLGLSDPPIVSANNKAQQSAEQKLSVLGRSAELARRNGLYERAAAEFKNIYQVCDSMAWEDGKAAALRCYGQAVLELGKYREAEQALLKARALTGAHRLKLEATDLPLARLYAATGRPQLAIQILDRLAAVYDSLYLHALLRFNRVIALESAAASIFWRRAEVFRALVSLLVKHDPTEGFRTIERERSLPFWAERSFDGGSLSSEVEHPIGEFVRTLEQYEQSPKAGDVQPLLTALGELRQRLMAEQDVLSASAVRASRIRIRSEQELQEVLEPGEVVLEYFMGDANVLVAVVRRDLFRILVLPEPVGKVHSAIEVHRETMMRGQSNSDDDLWKASALYLTESLLSPIVKKGFVRPGDHLIVSPHHALHRVPFHALFAPAEGSPLPALHEDGRLPSSKFLAEEYYVSYIPSASFLVRVRSTAPRALRSLLAVAPDHNSLRFTSDEIEHIPEDLFETKAVLQGGARADALLRQMKNFDMIHIAAHARMNSGYPLYSFIECGDDAGQVTRLKTTSGLAASGARLELHEILHQRIPARAIVLSACETGLPVGVRGEHSVGDDLVSFPRAFLESGTGAVIASLWLVDDEATLRLMTEFYQNLSEFRTQHGQSLSSLNQSRPSPGLLVQSIIAAQRRLISAQRDAAHSPHPFYWAAFFLIGDGR